MNVQQYHAGEKAEATFDFVQGERVRSVTATFVHVDNPTTKLYLSGTPLEETASEGAGYTYWRVVLTRDIMAGDEPGTYRCETVEGEYPGGRKVPFRGIPDVGLEIVEEEIPPPEITGSWRWGSES